MSETFSVLIVDDNPDMVKAMADVLEAKGFETYPAHSGAKALEILREHAVHVLLTDVIMQEMNGLELYRETKKMNLTTTTIFMTAYAADELIQKGRTEGIKAVLNKPVDIDLLLSLLNAIRNISRE